MTPSSTFVPRVSFVSRNLMWGCRLQQPVIWPGLRSIFSARANSVGVIVAPKPLYQELLEKGLLAISLYQPRRNYCFLWIKERPEHILGHNKAIVTKRERNKESHCKARPATTPMTNLIERVILESPDSLWKSIQNEIIPYNFTDGGYPSISHPSSLGPTEVFDERLSLRPYRISFSTSCILFGIISIINIVP